MRPIKTDSSTLTMGEGLIVIRKQGRLPVTATILGEEHDRPEKGLKTIWLDRVVHAMGEDSIGGCPVAGAMVTQVVMPMQVPA